ncbi:kinase-like domain-containing protein [Aspergillus californicus]
MPSQSRSFHPNWNDDEWYRYTRGRFLSKESYEMTIRHVEFNMNELAKHAAESIGLTDAHCVHIEKFPDGMFNKAFLFTMQDGRKVVGKVPNPNADRAQYTIASEVATMDFASNELNTPVPKVLAWSSKAGNSVGAEYIIMENVEGIQLNQVWPKMDIKQKFELVKAISGSQRNWMSMAFKQYGSLYYSSDLANSDGCVLVKEDASEDRSYKFAVGPSAGRGFLDDGRIAVDFDRGPWTSAEQYKQAVGLREIACLENMAQLPRSSLSLYGPGTMIPFRPERIAAVQNYLRLLKFLLPADQSIMSAYLWHPDLHTENIFVHPERPSEVLGIIDWQSSEILPLFDHARQPYILDYDGPSSTTLDPPTFPEDFDNLDPIEQSRSQDLYLRMSLAMEFQQTTSFDMMLFAQNLLIDGDALYQSRCLDLENEWTSLPGVQASGNPPFPLRLSPDEGVGLMQTLRQSLGPLWPEKGIVRPEQYGEVKGILKQAKVEMIEELEPSEAERAVWEESWPFDE